MRKIIAPFSVTLFGFLLWLTPSSVVAEDAFDKEYSTSVRTSYQLYGGNVEDLAIDSSGRMYAATLSANGIFTSNNQAQTWTGPQADADIGKVPAIAISDESNTAFIIGGISLFKTSNGGNTWFELTGSSGDAEGNNYNMDLAYANGTLIVANRDASVDVSVDEGETFTKMQIAESGNIRSIATDATGLIFYILIMDDSGQRRLYSLDSNTGEVMDSGVIGDYAWVNVKSDDDNFIVVAGADGALYTTTGIDGTWQTLTSDQVTGEISFLNDRIYLGNVYTDDLGDSFENFYSYSSQLAIDLNNTSIMLADSAGGVALSTDGGESWAETSTGILGVTVNDIAQVNDKETVWLAAEGGLAKASNFQTDNPIWEYPIHPDAQGDSTIRSVWVNPHDSNHVLAGAAGLYYSTDGGETWSETEGTAGLTGLFNDIISDDTTLYAAYGENDGSTGGVYVSENDGETWTELGDLNGKVNALALRDDGVVFAAVGHEFRSETDKRGIYVYSLADNSWSQIDVATNQAVMTIISAGDTFFAAGIGDPDGKAFRSTDGGITWENITDNGLPGAAYFQTLTAEADNTTIYVATGRPAATGYVYKTTDGGDNWSLLYTGLVDEEFNALLFDGLVTGSSIGVQALESKAQLTVSARKLNRAGEKVKLTILLKDAATKDGLNKRTIKLYKKFKKDGVWKRVKLSNKKSKTNRQGKIILQRLQTKTTYYQVRWKPTGEDRETYGSSGFRSKKLLRQ